MRISVTGGNLYTYNPVPDFAMKQMSARRFPGRLRKQKPLVMFLVEGRRAPRVKGYRRHRIPSSKQQAAHIYRGKSELVIYTRRGVKVDGVYHQKVAEASTPSKWAPTRYALVVRCRFRRKKFSAVVTHWHAVIQADDGGFRKGDRSEEAKKHSKNVDELLRNLRRQGYPPIMFADANMREDKHMDPLNPYKMWDGPLVWRARGIDGFCHDNAAFRASPIRRFRLPGSDHHGGEAGLATTYEVR